MSTEEHIDANSIMYFMCEKKSPYTASWTMRRCAFNCETRYLYYCSKSLHLSSPWKKVMKITSVTVPAEAEDFDVQTLFKRDNNTDGDHSERNLYRFDIQGVYRNIMAHKSPSSRAMPNALAFQRRSRGWPSKHSPRGDGYQYDKTVTYHFRADSEELLRKVVDIMRDVLADDGLCPPVNAGLPFHDPRNNIPLAHVPLYLGKPFKGLDKTVFYAFERGDLIGQSPTGEVGTAIFGGFLCITDEMVLLMRPDGTIPRWAAVDRIDSIVYNTKRAKLSFLAILSSSAAAADIVFVPSPPLLTADERRAYNGADHVRRIVDLVAKVNGFVGGHLHVAPEDKSDSVRAFIQGRAAGKRPIRFAPTGDYCEPLAFPLPKLELAKRTEAIRGEQQRENLRQQQQQRQQQTAQNASRATLPEHHVATIDLGEVGTGSPEDRHTTPSSALWQAVDKSTASASQGAQRWGQEDVLLALDSSEDDEGGADPDLERLSRQPPPGQGEQAPLPPAGDGGADDIELSDSADDLLLDYPSVETLPSSAAGGNNHAGTTLEELINQSAAAYPK